MPNITSIPHRADMRQCGLYLQGSGFPTSDPRNESDSPTWRVHPGQGRLHLQQQSLLGRGTALLLGSSLARGRGRGKASFVSPVCPDGVRALCSWNPTPTGDGISRSNSQEVLVLPNLILKLQTILNTIKCVKTTIFLNTLDIFLSIC